MPHVLTAITIAGYKSFAAPTMLELRPLTLLYGRNNAGKSALLRLLPILASSVAPDATTPFVLAGRAGRDAHYREVLWKGQSHRQIQLDLHWKDDSAEHDTDRFTLDYIDEIDQVIVRRMEIVTAQGTVFEALPYPDHGTYRVKGGDEQVSFIFSGLIAKASLHRPDPPDPVLDNQQSRLKGLRHNVLWLESVRSLAGGLIKKPGAPQRSLGPDGREASEVLLTSREICDEVASWYRDHVGRRLEIREVSHPHHRVVLNPLDAPSAWDIDIAHTGEGMTQVLPVLVGAALARRASHGIFAVEEPESHLHPDAQKALASHLAGVAAADQPPTIVIETHSRSLLLGVQLAVARGILPPERVCAHWVDIGEDGASQATLVEFDEHGKLRNWPRTAFSDDRALARELLEYELKEFD